MENTKPKVTPKDFFLWLGAMGTLYVSVVSILTLYFEYIDFLFPDPLVTYFGDPYSGGIRFAIASLIVVTPLYVYLTRTINAEIRVNPEKKDLWVRRWLIYITLFIGGVTLAVDLIALINTFLGGELTMRFVLKVVAVFAVVSGFFWYYLSDLRGVWERKASQAHMLGYSVGALVLLSIVSGFFIIGSPMDQRLYRFDEQKVADLQNIQWQIVNFWQQKETLPADLSELNDPLAGFTLPVDPQTGEAYRYERTSNASFELCATFNKDSRSMTAPEVYPITSPSALPGTVKDPLNGPFTHVAGEVCYDRTIDPERYPPYSKTR